MYKNIIKLSMILLAISLFSCGGDEPTDLSDAKVIKTFKISDVTATIDETAKTIYAEVPQGSDLKTLKPTVKYSSKASITPKSMSTVDFTNSVTYVVTAEDGSTAEYTASIKLKACNYGDVYAFIVDGKNYELVKEKANWIEAKFCAQSKGGYLAEINSASEDAGIFNALKAASISINKTVSNDGGGASYIWMGANDIENEGKWKWENSNKHFWDGGVDGVPVNGAYSNWGTEPDDYSDNQDCMGLAITQWPISTGSLGNPGQWNDVSRTNRLYYVIEFD